MKKFLKITLALCLSLLAVLLIASCTKEDEGLDFEVNQQPSLAFRLSTDGSYYAVAGMGNLKATEVTIPATYAGKPVKVIAREAFANCTSITAIDIPASVTNVEVDAFKGCTGLLQQEGGVTYAGKWAVACDTTATKVTLRDGTVGIAQGAFYQCAELTNVSIPASVKNVCAGAFTECEKLIQKADGGFYVDKWLVGTYVTKELTIRQNTVGFAAMAFREGKLAEGEVFTVPNSVKYINDWAFANAVNFPYVVLHDSVEGIGFGAFYNTTGLKGISLGKGLKTIDAEAFYSCKNLEEVVVWDVKAWMGISFNGANAYPNAYGSLLFVDAEGNLVTNLTIPASVDSIGWRVFENATALTKVTIPASVKSIASAAFRGCTALNSVSIPTSITKIEEQTFYGCTSLTSITIPASVTVIDAKAFDACEKLFEVINLSALTVTAGDTANGKLAFWAKDVYTTTNVASKLSTDENGFVFYNDGETNYLLAYAGGKSDIVLPEQYKGSAYTLYANAFAGLDIESVVIPATVEEISNSLFGDGATITAVYFAGTFAQWNEVGFGSGNEAWAGLVRYYSEEQPTEKFGDYWHYVEGVPTVWEDPAAKK